MNAKTAKLIRQAARFVPGARAEYADPVLHKVLQMQAYETYERTIREMGPVSPGAPTNLRFQPELFDREAKEFGMWVERSGCRRLVTSRVVEKIRYQVDGKTPRRALLRMNADTKAYEPVYHLIPCAKPVHLAPGSPKRVYRELKRLEGRVGLDELFRRLSDEQFDSLVGTA